MLWKAWIPAFAGMMNKGILVHNCVELYLGYQSAQDTKDRDDIKIRITALLEFQAECSGPPFTGLIVCHCEERSDEAISIRGT
jgi:hypothetical protein